MRSAGTNPSPSPADGSVTRRASASRRNCSCGPPSRSTRSIAASGNALLPSDCDRALALRPIEEDRVERLALFREANVFGPVNGFNLSSENIPRRRRLGRSFAELAPWPGGENRLAVALRPGRDPVDDGLFLLVDRAVAAHRNVEQQVAVLGDDVGQHLNDQLGRLVGVVAIDAPRIMPPADARVRLPRIRADLVEHPTFHVFDDRPPLDALELLSEQHDIDIPAAFDRAIVHVRRGLQAGLTERQTGIVEIHEVRPIIVDDLVLAEQPGADELRVERRRGLPTIARRACRANPSSPGRT